MPLIDSWTESYTISGTTQQFTFPRAVSVGETVFLSIGRGGSGTVTNISAVGTNVWQILRAGPHSNNTFNGALIIMRVTQAISAGATFIITASSTSNRWTLAGGIFDDVLSLTGMVYTEAISESTPVVNAGPTDDMVTSRALVVTAVAMTSNGSPIIHQGNKIVDQIVTAVGSADRGCALLFKYEGGHPHTGSFGVSNSSTSWSATVAVPSTDLPPGTIPYMTDEGEVPGMLTVWDGLDEIPVTGLDVVG